MPPTRSSEIELHVERGTTDELPFYCVSPVKLAVLSVVTFGLYELFWFYRNWQRVRERTGRAIRPFWRAFFAPLFCFALASTVASAAGSLRLPRRAHPVSLGLAYAAILMLQRLPDPWWLLCLLSFVPLLVMARQIQEIHDAMRPGFASEVGWGRGALATLAIGGLFSFFPIAGMLGPPTHVLRGTEIPASYHTTLAEAGVLEPDERIDFFYSAGFLSILDDGNLLTDRRVVSYEKLEGELHVYSSPYDDIRDLEVRYTKSALEPTIIEISTRDTSFALIVSGDEGRDREFVGALRKRIPAQP